MYENIAVNEAVNVDPYAETIPATMPQNTPVIEGIEIRSENRSCDIPRREMTSVTQALKKLSKNVGPDRNRHRRNCKRYLCASLRGSTMYLIRRSHKDLVGRISSGLGSFCIVGTKFKIRDEKKFLTNYG